MNSPQGKKGGEGVGSNELILELKSFYTQLIIGHCSLFFLKIKKRIQQNIYIVAIYSQTSPLVQAPRYPDYFIPNLSRLHADLLSARNVTSPHITYVYNIYIQVHIKKKEWLESICVKGKRVGVKIVGGDEKHKIGRCVCVPLSLIVFSFCTTK